MLLLPADLIVGQTAFMYFPTLHREWLDLFLEVSRQQTFILCRGALPRRSAAGTTSRGSRSGTTV